jgi:two-component system cell cycle sensor histidine kinase PleC
MAANASMSKSEDRDRAYRARLKDEPLPAAVIDCATAEVLAANAGGLNALGLTPADRLPVPLDSAMPAIKSLRDLHRSGLQETKRQTLVFWRYGRTSIRHCDISATGETADAHVIVLFRTDPETADPLPALPIQGPANAANDDTPPRVVRDDSETLKEIARRIREGQDVRPTPAEPAVSLDAPTPSSILAALPAPEVENAVEADRPSERPAQVSPREAARALPIEDIAKLAHELKTPLTAIAAAAEIMRDQSLGAMGNDKYLGYAADIHDSATHALAVIGEMLNAVPPDRNLPESGGAFDLTDLAEKTVSALKPLATQRGLTLALDADYNLMPVRANTTAIRQILLNLLTNALKFTPEGGDVRVVTGYLDDGAIFFVVRDTGDGMSDDAIAHAYDEGPETLAARPGGGRGIGLRLVRRLASENGCAFEIDSAPGQGTVVLIAFPTDLVGER